MVISLASSLVCPAACDGAGVCLLSAIRRWDLLQLGSCSFNVRLPEGHGEGEHEAH